MSRTLFTVPAKPERITLDTLDELFAHNRARFGGWSMTLTPPEPTPDPTPPAPTPPASPARPEDVTEEEWNALGDPGRTALTRERERRQAAERALAASRARPTPPAPTPKPDDGKPPADPPKDPSGNIDVAAIVQQAVEAAIKPFQEREEQREADEAAGAVQKAVLDAAKLVLHDETDALTGISLVSVVDDQGRADPVKVQAALKDLVTRKPHLAKVIDDRRFAPDDVGPTPGGSTRPLNDRVKDTLARMQERAGVKFADLP